MRDWVELMAERYLPDWRDWADPNLLILMSPLLLLGAATLLTERPPLRVVVVGGVCAPSPTP